VGFPFVCGCVVIQRKAGEAASGATAIAPWRLIDLGEHAVVSCNAVYHQEPQCSGAEQALRCSMQA
jgi:hypothetical protein